MDLHRIVRETGQEFPEIADPGDLADKVFGKIDPGDYADAVRLMLRSYVRGVLSEARRTLVPVRESAVQPFHPSRKIAAIRETWRVHLGDRIHVGAAQWKLLRDCTAVDLKSAAEERRRLAAENVVSARQYEELATALERDGAGTVFELGDDVLQPILG